MATYVNDLRLKEIATGDEAGTWGTSTNTNLELVAEAFSYGTEASFSSDADTTTTMADGATDPIRSLYLKVTSSVDLTATRTLTISPNTVSKVWIIENATSGSQSIAISQGSGANVTVPNGSVKVIYTDGAGSGAAVVDAFTDLDVSGTFKVAGNTTLGGTFTGGGLMTTGGNIVIPNAGNIGSASDTDAMAIASSGVVTFSQIPLFSLGLGATSFNDNNITNVGDIALDSISSDAGTTVTVTLGTDAGDDFLVGNNNAFVVTGDNDRVGIGTADPSVALDIGSETDAILIAKGTTAQRPTGAAGQFRYNTTLEKFEGYTTEWGEIGGGTSTNTFTTDILAGDGSTTDFTISQAVDEDNLVVFIDGVFQAQNAYSVSGTTLTMSAAPANGAVLTVYSVKGAVAGSNFGIATMTGDDSDTTLTLPFNPVNENNVQVYIDGVYQNKDTFSVSGTTLTFSTAPPTGTAVEAMVVSQTSVNTATILKDADEDTKVEVEQSTDEDKIRFTTGGTQAAIIDDSQRMGIGVSTMSNKLVVGGTEAADTTYLRLQNTPATAATHKVAMEFWGNEGTANASTFNMGRIYGEFDGSTYATTRLTLGSASGSGTFNDEISLKNGNVGIGTTSIDEKIHVEVASGDAAIKLEDASGDFVRIDQNSVGANDKIRFKSGSGLTEAMRVNANQQLAVNSTISNVQGKIFIDHTGADTDNWGLRFLSTSSSNPVYIVDFIDYQGQRMGSIQGNSSSNTITYGTSSDYRLKENVSYDWDATTRLKQLRPARFNWIRDESNTLVDGFLAHEVEDIVPEAISGEKDATETYSNVVLNSYGNLIDKNITESEWEAGKEDDTYDEDTTWAASHTQNLYQAIDQSKLVPLLVKTIQELEARITTLENA